MGLLEDYTTASGKSTEDYSKALSLNAKVEAECSGFSGSPKADFTAQSSQSGSLANTFTRTSYYNVSIQYIISLLSIDKIRGMIDPNFLKSYDDTADAAIKGNILRSPSSSIITALIFSVLL